MAILTQAGIGASRQVASGWRGNRRGGRWPAIAFIVALHGLGLYAALQIGAVRETLEEAAPLFVSFIAARTRNTGAAAQAGTAQAQARAAPDLDAAAQRLANADAAAARS